MVNPLFEDELYLLGGRALLLRGYQLDFIKEFGIQAHGEAGVSLRRVRVGFGHGLIPLPWKRRCSPFQAASYQDE